MKRIYIIIVIGIFLGACTGNPLPNVTPTVAPPTFINTPIAVNDTPSGPTSTPSPTRTATATRTGTPSPTQTLGVTNTPRPPTITPIGTNVARGTPRGTPNCGTYDCGPVQLPNLPLLNSPTPYPTITPRGDDSQLPLSPTADPRTLIAIQITPIVLNGTEVGIDQFLDPIPLGTLEEIDTLGDYITPIGGGGFGEGGDAFGMGGAGLGFDGTNNVVGFGNSPNDTIWIAYVKGLFDPNVNYFGPFSPLVALLMTYVSLNFIFIVANLFIPLIAIMVKMFKVLVRIILDFIPWL